MSSDDQIREPLILDGGKDDVSRLELRNHGEAFPRVQMRSDGTIVTGDGTKAPDDPLLRASEGGGGGGGASDASEVAFDPEGTGLEATNVQDAIEELDARVVDAADVTYTHPLVVEFKEGWPSFGTGTYLDFTEYPLSFDLIIDGGETQHIELTGDYGTVLQNDLFEALNDVTTGATWFGLTWGGVGGPIAPRLVHDNPHIGASIEIANLVNGDGETYVSGIVEGTWVQVEDDVEQALDRTAEAISTLGERVTALDWRVTALEGEDGLGPVLVYDTSDQFVNGDYWEITNHLDRYGYRQFVTLEVTYGNVYGPDDSLLDPPPPMAFVVEKQVIDTDGENPEYAWEEVGRIEFNNPYSNRKVGRVSFVAEDVSEYLPDGSGESAWIIEGVRPMRLVAELGAAESADVTVRTYLR